MGGFHTDVQRRIETSQLHQRILHRQHATAHARAAGIDVGIALEDFRETLIHTTGNTLKLVGTLPCQVAPMVLSILADDIQTVQHIFTCSRQLAQTVGLGQYVVGGIIETGLAVEAGAMSPVMTDVERLISTRCWRQLLLRRSWIGHIVAGRQQDILAYFIKGRLSVKRC